MEPAHEDDKELDCITSACHPDEPVHRQKLLNQVQATLRVTLRLTVRMTRHGRTTRDPERLPIAAPGALPYKSLRGSSQRKHQQATRHSRGAAVYPLRRVAIDPQRGAATILESESTTSTFQRTRRNEDRGTIPKVEGQDPEAPEAQGTVLTILEVTGLEVQSSDQVLH